MNIFEAIREDHDTQRELGKELIKTSGDSSKRHELFVEYKKELHVHENAEERHFYIPLIDHDLTQEMARHGIAEHHEIDELIEQLDETDYSSTGWLTIAKKLVDEVEHHLEEEEHRIFQMAGKVLKDNQKSNLAIEYKKSMSSFRNDYE